MSDRESLRRHVEGEIGRATGRRYAALQRDTQLLSVEALMDFRRLLFDVADEKRQAERTYRPFPGGPKVRF